MKKRIAGDTFMNKEILRINQPFSYAELQKKGILVKRSELETLVDNEKLHMKKIGRMIIYWNELTPYESKSGLDTLNDHLELELNELKKELMAERQKVRKLSIQDGIDNPWKETALEMARILSEQKQVALREILEHFNAPIENESL